MNRLVKVATVCLAVVSLSSCNPLPTVESPSNGAAFTTTPASPEARSPSTSTQATGALPPSSLRPSTTSTVANSLALYVLELINSDRAQFGLEPVLLGTNPAAQIHAQDMFDNYFLSHWGTDGLKPYMRYTVGGGTNYEEENSAYSGWYDRSVDPRLYAIIDPKQELEQLQYQMMYDDAGSNWGHRDNILNKWHKKVNIGIAHDSRRLTMVEQFEGDYLELAGPPALGNGTLSLDGVISLGVLDSVAVFYDPLPLPTTQSDLLNGPKSYSLGTRVVTVLPTPPPGYYYSQLPENAVEASKWEVSGGAFAVQADISMTLDQHGPGVYTVVVWTKVDADYVMLSNYSLFVR